MKGKFKDRKTESILDSKAIFKICQLIFRYTNDKTGITTKDIMEELENTKSQPTISLILSLLEERSIVKVFREKKIKKYFFAPESLHALFVESNQETPPTEYDKKLEPILKSNTLFRNDFFFFLEKNFDAPYIESFSSFFKFFQVFYVIAYFDLLEPFMVVDMQSKPGSPTHNIGKIVKSNPEFSQLLEIWKICSYFASDIEIGEPGDFFKPNDFPGYSLAFKHREKFMEEWKD